jgi:hypothetical protein
VRGFLLILPEHLIRHAEHRSDPFSVAGFCEKHDIFRGHTDEKIIVQFFGQFFPDAADAEALRFEITARKDAVDSGFF